MKISIIGAGKMGTALYESTKDRFDVELCGRGDAVNGDTVVFCVKPQDFSECISALPDLENKLIISIMAGVSLETLLQKTGSKKAVRAMPNLAVQVGAGFTSWMGSPDLSTSNREWARAFFECFGAAIELNDETQMDAITALSASGPGYFFYFCELMEAQAEAWDFAPEEAQNIVKNTFIGTAALLQNSKKSFREWKEAVRSKKGTTDAALKHWEEEGFEALFKAGIQAAKKRSQELH